MESCQRSRRHGSETLDETGHINEETLMMFLWGEEGPASELCNNYMLEWMDGSFETAF